MNPNRGRRAARGGVVAPRRGGGETADAVPRHGARDAPRRQGSRVARAMIDRPCDPAFGGGIAELELG